MDNPGRPDLNLKLVKPTVPDCPESLVRGRGECPIIVNCPNYLVTAEY